MGIFKIFYSWQSDLPGGRTRNFIRECIDEAIDLALETEAIEAVRDEATSGTTGSPNIVTTLFSKIDECDLFIADLSLCFTEDQKKEKRSPNPNVLLELGYAVKTLGWERVICLCNNDYGNEYPFDVAHNRITDYSLDGKSRKEVKNEISRIIFTNIRDLRKQRPRANAGTAVHIIGSYDFENRTVIESLVPLEIENQEGFNLHNMELITDSSNLLSEIQELTKQIRKKEKAQEGIQVSDGIQKYDGIAQLTELDYIRNLSKSYIKSENPVVWIDEQIDRERIKRWLGAEVVDDFFELGGLKKVEQIFDMHNSTLVGLDEEKAKYDKLMRLSYKLTLLDMRTTYLKTFKGMFFIPLAIQNVSAIQDRSIRVVISVNTGEIVNPSGNLICKELDGLQGIICRDDEGKEEVGVICELFSLKEDGVIHVEEPFIPSRSIQRIPIMTKNGYVLPDKTEEDYKLELEEFIASAEGRGYYEFDIENLRPNECKWLSCGLLIKPVDNTIRIQYQITSTHSTGDLKGSLELQAV